MAKNDFTAEAAENYEQKCLCILVLDVSGSMYGKPIDELNKGLQEFYNEISTDDTTSQRLEVSLITFNQIVRTVQEPALVENFTIPQLEANGSTAMVNAVNEAIDKVATRKQWYKSTGQAYYRPWIILMTDGEPDSDQDVDMLAQRIKQDTANKRYAFLPIGVEGANMEILDKIKGNIPPMKLQGTKFSSFFKWLSASMDTVVTAEEGQQVDFSAGADDWMCAFTIGGSGDEIDMDCQPNDIQEEHIIDNDADGCSPSNNENSNYESETTGCIGVSMYDLDFNPITGEFKTETQDCDGEMDEPSSTIEYQPNLSDTEDDSNSVIIDEPSFKGSYELVFNPKIGQFEQIPVEQIGNDEAMLTEMSYEGFAGPAVKEREKTISTFEPSIENEKQVANEKESLWSRFFKKRIAIDKIYSSIFAPAEVKRKSHMLVQVYLHLYEETEKVKTLAQESDRNAERRDYIPLQCKLKKGDKVDVLLNIYGETLLMSDKKSVVWQGSFTKCSFDYFVPKDIDVDELSCVALLSVNGVPVGEMRFITQIVEVPRQLNPEILAHKYSKVFISYSHQDESKVKFLHEGLELGAVPHFFDRKYLKAGDVFPQVIQDYINSADLFILCWSENASKSEYVQKERLQALERAFPQVKPEQAAKLRIYPMSIEPHAELPGDMKNYYHFGEI